MSNNLLLINTKNIFKSDRICTPIEIVHLSPTTNVQEYDYLIRLILNMIRQLGQPKFLLFSLTKAEQI